MPSDLRIAVLTGVHGNGFAAEAVAAEIRRAAPDLSLNLGDQVYGQAPGLSPQEPPDPQERDVDREHAPRAVRLARRRADQGEVGIRSE